MNYVVRIKGEVETVLMKWVCPLRNTVTMFGEQNAWEGPDGTANYFCIKEKINTACGRHYRLPIAPKLPFASSSIEPKVGKSIYGTKATEHY